MGRLPLIGMLLFGLAACALSAVDVPVQDWWKSRGPVVPHDSFPADCTLCHTGSDWNTIVEDFEYDHLAETGVALDGAHARAECIRCHNDRGPVQVFAARGCSGCHENVHRGQLGDRCVDCHTEETWKPKESIAEHARTGFPLVGAHAAVSCWRCHSGAQEGIFTGASTDCATCHASEAVAARSVDHVAQGWTANCQECHAPLAWSQAAFIHDGFPLNGAHGAASCDACHAGAVFAGTPSDCSTCHANEYQATTRPPHASAGFPTDCASCHGVASWEGANFDHDTFQLSGAHTATDCSACHVGGVFAGTPTDCASCHQADFQATTDPNHVTAGFPQNCESCHSEFSWDRGLFDHSSFPLTGAHVAADCAQCHSGGVFAGTPSDCASCHLSEYRAANDPNHSIAGFPTACDLCHTTNAWERANFDHSFPIDRGDHAGFDCADCHTSPRSFASFSCTHCHEHRQSEMDDEHDDVGGYVWSSPACLQCHPNGDD